MNNRHFTVCGIVEIDGKVLLKAYHGDLTSLQKSSYVPTSSLPEEYAMFL